MSSRQPTPSDARAAVAGRLIVGVSDMIATNDAEATIVTYALGSCLGLTVHDARAQVGAMLHVMLPDSSIDEEKASANPAMFVDTGVPRLFHEAYRLGAAKERLVVKVAGGAAVSSGTDMFEIGKRNIAALREILRRNRIAISAHDVGGSMSRTMSLDMKTGEVTLRIDGADTCL
jgi:chemotaxis protein CheD